MLIRKLCLALVSLIMINGLSGCGFQLRDNYQIPATLQQLYVQPVASLELQESLRQRLMMAGVGLAEQPSQTNIRLQIINDNLERRTLSLFESGQVAEYELLYKVSYQVRQRDEIVIAETLEVTRDYQDDPNFALAKTRERDMLVTEMRDEAARRIIRNMISEFADN